ncbi:Monocarboxylate transporter 1 [Nymphon striatum]|nr:Monocarboxylate transporter 1 [Nymphon striatum]
MPTAEQIPRAILDLQSSLSSDVLYLEDFLILLKPLSKPLKEGLKTIKNYLSLPKIIVTFIVTDINIHIIYNIYYNKRSKVTNNFRKAAQAWLTRSTNALERLTGKFLDRQEFVITMAQFDTHLESYDKAQQEVEEVTSDDDPLQDIEENAAVRKVAVAKYSDAEHCVDGLSINKTNYEVAIKLLKDRFGSKEVITFSYIQNVLALEIQNENNYIVKLKHFQDDLQVMETKSKNHMDSRQSWIVMAATFQINFMVLGILKSGGVFYVGIYKAYNADRADVALITVTTFGFSSIARSGFGIGFVPVMSILSRFFKVHLAKASGISLAGSSIGTILIPPLAEYFIEEFGLRGMFLLMSGVVLNTFISVCFIYDPPNEMPVNNTTTSHKEKDSSQNMTSGDSNAELTVNMDDTMNLKKVHNTENIFTGNINVNFEKNESKTDNVEINIGSHRLVKEESFKDDPGVSKKRANYQKLFQSLRSAFITHLRYFINPYFTMLILGYLLLKFLITLYSISIPDIGFRSGGSLINGASLISLTSFCDLVGRILIGTLIDKRFINLGYSYGITMLLNGLIVICIGIFEKDTYSLHMVLCGLFGFAYSSLLVHFTVVITHYVGPTSVPTVISLGSILAVVQTVLLAEMINYFLRTFNGYANLYLISGGLLVLASLFWIGVGIKETLASRLTKLENRNTEN